MMTSAKAASSLDRRRRGADDRRAVGLRKKLFALTYDRQLANVEKAGLADVRRGLLGGATGRVVEVGGGTGANLAYYGQGVESLTVTEPDEDMLRRLRRRVGEESPETDVVQAPAEELPFEDGSFDTAVTTLVLCGVEDQGRSLRELRRVLRPGGRLIFIEHVRSEEPRMARWQDRLNGLSKFVACCNCWVRPLIAGTATAPADAA